MKFNQFTLRQLLANTDYLVGYDSNTGNYIRIAKDDLIDTMQYPTAEDLDINVQYSSNASSWHNTLTTGDRYIRLRVNEYSWTAAINVQTLVHDGRTVVENLRDNQSSYLLKDEGKRKVFTVKINDNASISIQLDAYEECGIMVENTDNTDVSVTFSASGIDDIIETETVAVPHDSKVWITMQRVDTLSNKYIIIQKTNL